MQPNNSEIDTFRSLHLLTSGTCIELIVSDGIADRDELDVEDANRGAGYTAIGGASKV